MRNPNQTLTIMALLSAAFFCRPVFGADDEPVKKKPPVPEATDKSTRLMGKVVDLYDYMTGRKPVPTGDVIPTPPAPSPKKADSKLEKSTATDAPGGSPEPARRVYALDTLNDGLVILHFKDPPVVLFPTEPVPALNKPVDPDGTQARRMKISDSGPEYWVGKQVRLSGTLYERNRVKYFVVYNVLKSQDDVPPVKSLPVPNK